MRTVVDYLRRMAARGQDALGDGDLLESFLIRRDAHAFETLVRRHGPMVLGVCRRLLHNVHDAEDAFQATFLVLARKAADVRPPDMVGHWLYGVAYRTARKALAMNAKRRRKERNAMRFPPEETDDQPPEELLARLDAEVHRLPEKYRAPVVLCELQGKSRKEVAKILGLAEGTLSWRLAHARKLLAQRLAPYGSMLSAAVLSMVLSRESACARVPPALVTATTQAGLQSMTAGMVSASVLALAEGVVHAMFYSKLKLMGMLVLALAVSGGIGLSYRASAADPQRTGHSTPAVRTAADEIEELRLEVAALRKGLEVMRERVRTLENERQTAKAKDQPATAVRKEAVRSLNLATTTYRTAVIDKVHELGIDARRPTEVTETIQKVIPYVVRTEIVPQTRTDIVYRLALVDPIAQAEAALKKLRKNPNDKQAMQDLANAWKQLQDRAAQAPPAKDKKKSH